MKKNILYGAIIVIGVGAIAYMYNMTDKASKDYFDDDFDEAVSNQQN